MSRGPVCCSPVRRMLGRAEPAGLPVNCPPERTGPHVTQAWQGFAESCIHDGWAGRRCSNAIRIDLRSIDVVFSAIPSLSICRQVLRRDGGRRPRSVGGDTEGLESSKWRPLDEVNARPATDSDSRELRQVRTTSGESDSVRCHSGCATLRFVGAGSMTTRVSNNQ